MERFGMPTSNCEKRKCSPRHGIMRRKFTCNRTEESSSLLIAEEMRHGLVLYKYPCSNRETHAIVHSAWLSRMQPKKLITSH